MQISKLEIILVILYCSMAGYFAQKWLIGKANKVREKTDIDDFNDKANRFADKGQRFVFRFFCFWIFGFFAFYLYTKVKFW